MNTYVEGKGFANAKLTETQVREIRRRYVPGKNRTKLALEYGVTRQTIRNICRRSSWSWLDPIPVSTEDW